MSLWQTALFSSVLFTVCYAQMLEEPSECLVDMKVKQTPCQSKQGGLCVLKENCMGKVIKQIPGNPLLCPLDGTEGPGDEVVCCSRENAMGVCDAMAGKCMSHCGVRARSITGDCSGPCPMCCILVN